MHTHNRHLKKVLWKPAKQYFDGVTLFDELARTICDAECLPRKELYESWAFAKRVQRRLRGRRIVDLACGHGLVAHICSLLDPGFEEAVAVDQAIPKNAPRLKSVLASRWPRLQVAYVECPLEEFALRKSDVVVSAHACGELTDLVIERALGAGASLAVLPCCHQRAAPIGLEGWMASDAARDVMRAQRLLGAGYEVRTSSISREITPKNRVLIGWRRADYGSGQRADHCHQSGTRSRK
jgi:hypothetical protein